MIRLYYQIQTQWDNVFFLSTSLCPNERLNLFNSCILLGEGGIRAPDAKVDVIPLTLCIIGFSLLSSYTQSCWLSKNDVWKYDSWWLKKREYVPLSQKTREITTYIYLDYVDMHKHSQRHTHTHTHTHIYIYICVRVCVCVCICVGFTGSI